MPCPTPRRRRQLPRLNFSDPLAMTSAADSPFVLPADLNIYEAAALRASLLDWLQTGHAQLLDGAAVEHVDLAGVQVLLMAQEQSLRLGGSLHLGATSAALHEALQLIGLSLETPAETAVPAGV